VTVANCEVTLQGSVNSREAKRLAEDVEESVHGVRDINNQLRVSRDEGHDARGSRPGRQTQSGNNA
jgi:hypothetical protein